MRCIFLLSKEDLRFAKEEALSLFNVKHKLRGNLLFLEIEDIKPAERLAYTKKTYQFLFRCRKDHLIEKLKGFDWNSIYKKSFCVRAHKDDGGLKIKEKDIAGYIWERIKNPKVDLESPATLIEFFVMGPDVYAAKLVKELDQGFDSRKAHKRPELHPTSLNPKMARALVNLSGAEKEVVDPFCGAGGILIEAGLIGLKPVGYELYGLMVKKAKANLEHYKIKDYSLFNKDALSISRKYDNIVTDLPYGMNTSIWVKEKGKNRKISLKQTEKREKRKNLEDFYLRFLKALKKALKKKAVVVFPDYVGYKALIKKAGLRIEKEFSQFVHGSLTRKIVVLR
ncbi:hypothetical protein KY358_02190 [Candidatus Woesearchaeota archaeon]|nr:hypothetical protein [Candidatus Woesearchaeota archaeon]